MRPSLKISDTRRERVVAPKKSLYAVNDRTVKSKAMV